MNLIMNVKGRRQLTFIFTNTKTDMVEHNCSLSYFGEWSRRIIWAHEFKKKINQQTGNTARETKQTKITKALYPLKQQFYENKFILLLYNIDKSMQEEVNIMLKQ